jgi:ABC-type bacteriocin/lantibiotic exporter with double-glycine peptidase domain
MRAILPHLRQQRLALAWTFAIATIGRLLILVDPLILRLIVDRYVMKLASMPRQQFFRGILLLIGATIVVGALARLCRTAQEYSIAMVARRAGAKLYAKSIAHSLLLPFREFEAQRSGELLYTIQRGRDDAESAIGGVVRLYLGALAVTAVTIYAFTLHPLLGTIHVVLLPLASAIVLTISVPIRKRQIQIARETAALSGSATEAIRNVELLKSMGAETQHIARLHDANERILTLEQEKLRLIRRFTFFEGTLFLCVRAVFLVTMLYLVYNRAITTGEFLALFLYTSIIFQPIAEAGQAVARYQEARATFTRLDNLLDLPVEERSTAAEPTGPITSIAFDQVSLRYADAPAAALRGVDLRHESKGTNPFTGASGAGKSSIL